MTPEKTQEWKLGQVVPLATSNEPSILPPKGPRLFRSGGRRAKTIACAGKVVWDSSTLGTCWKKPQPAPRPKTAPPMKKKAPTKALGGLHLTTRLKRKGGMQAIEARRVIEFALIANHKPRNDSERELLPGVLEWLLENPVRTLPVLTKEFFGWA
jgi:hypothetical protein